MKVELVSLEPDIPRAVLIYGADRMGVAALIAAVEDLAAGKIGRIAVHLLPRFESVDGCQLVFSRAERDAGLRLLAPPAGFDLSVRSVTWGHIAGLLEPFLGPISPFSFQYLDGDLPPSDYGLIFSVKRFGHRLDGASGKTGATP